MARMKLKTLSYAIDYRIIGHVQCSQRIELIVFFFLLIFAKFSSNWVNLYFITALVEFVLWMRKDERARHFASLTSMLYQRGRNIREGFFSSIVMRLFLIVFFLEEDLFWSIFVDL